MIGWGLQSSGGIPRGLDSFFSGPVLHRHAVMHDEHPRGMVRPSRPIGGLHNWPRRFSLFKLISRVNSGGRCGFCRGGGGRPWSVLLSAGCTAGRMVKVGCCNTYVLKPFLDDEMGTGNMYVATFLQKLAPNSVEQGRCGDNGTIDDTECFQDMLSCPGGHWVTGGQFACKGPAFLLCPDPNPSC